MISVRIYLIKEIIWGVRIFVMIDVGFEEERRFILM